MFLLTFVFTIIISKTCFQLLCFCSFVKCSLVFHYCRGSPTFRKRTLKATTEFTCIKVGLAFSFDQAGMQLVWARLCNIWHFGFCSFAWYPQAAARKELSLNQRYFMPDYAKEGGKKIMSAPAHLFLMVFANVGSPGSEKAAVKSI